MKIVLPLSAVLLAGWVVSCTPVQEDVPPTPPSDVAANSGTAPDQVADAGQEMLDSAASGGDEVKNDTESVQETISERVEDPMPANPTPKNAVPVARRVPGRDGFVFSPFNNKMINVKGFASGTMVADPTYPPAEKKYFRVP